MKAERLLKLHRGESFDIPLFYGAAFLLLGTGALCLFTAACILIWQGYRWLMDDVWTHISASEPLDMKVINSVIAGGLFYLTLVTGVLAMASFILIWNREE